MLTRHIKFLIIALLFSMLWQLSAVAATMLPPGPVPHKVKVGLYITDIISIEESNELLTFEGILTVQWQDKQLAFTADRGAKVHHYTDTAAVDVLAKVWQPQIKLDKVRGQAQVDARYVSISDTGVVTYKKRFLATIESHMNLRRFPFDSQVVNIELRPFVHPSNHVQLVAYPPYSGIAKDAHLEEWTIKSFKTFMANVPERAGVKQKISLFTIALKYQRKPVYYLSQIMGPLILVVFLSFSVFWITHTPIVNRIAISLTAVLTIVVFQWRVFRTLPKISYHTYMDLFMLISFGIAGLTIVASVILEYATTNQKKLTRLCKIWFPLIYLILIIIISILFLLIDIRH